MSTPTTDRDVIQSALRVLAAEEYLLRHFAAGMSPGDLAKSLNCSPPAATRTLKTLAAAGRAERVEQTERWRASHRLGRIAIQAVHSLDRAIAEAGESRKRLDPEGTTPVQFS